MYHLFKVSMIRWVLGIFGLAFFIPCYLVLQPANLVELFKVFSMASLGLVLFFGVIGQTFVFDWLLILLGRPLKIPRISGNWTGHVSSNWPLVGSAAEEKNHELNGIPLLQKPCSVKITSRLFSIQVIYGSDDKYTDSTTITAKPVRQSSGCVRLFFLYEAQTPIPKATDSSKHYGGAYLDIDRETKNTLDGRYWTDRNWHNGLNTAGVLELTKDK